jgi:hypothetical protein
MTPFSRACFDFLDAEAHGIVTLQLTGWLEPAQVARLDRLSESVPASERILLGSLARQPRPRVVPRRRR